MLRQNLWFRFSLRTLLVITTLVVVLLSMIGRRMHANAEENAIADSLRNFRGIIRLHTDENDTAKNPDRFTRFFDTQYVSMICIDGNGLTDEEMHDICKLRRLKTLRISNADITDDGLIRIGRLDHLACLNIGRTQITDAAIERLVELPELKTLGLYETQITDASIGYLKSMQQLTTLDIRKTAISDFGFDELQTALPNCEVKR